jgi:hypothetical protein
MNDASKFRPLAMIISLLPMPSSPTLHECRRRRIYDTNNTQGTCCHQHWPSGLPAVGAVCVSSRFALWAHVSGEEDGNDLALLLRLGLRAACPFGGRSCRSRRRRWRWRWRERSSLRFHIRPNPRWRDRGGTWCPAGVAADTRRGEVDPSLVRPRLHPAVVPRTLLPSIPPRPHPGSGPGGIGRGGGNIDELVRVLRYDLRRQADDDDAVGTERLREVGGAEIRHG